jgi:hypothetical protein
VARDELIRYLLHQLPEAERDALTERWMTDPALYEALRDIEAELFDRYARGAVTADERQSIERHLLNSASQRDKLAFAEALNTIHPARARRLTWLPAAVAAAVILTTAVGWLFWQNQSLTRMLDEARRRPPAVAQSAVGGVYSMFLPLTSMRGPGADARISMPADTGVLRLELEIEPGDNTKTFAATASTAGRIAWTAAPLRAVARGSGFVVVLWIPADALPAGRYEIALTAEGKPIAFYPLLVAR